MRQALAPIAVYDRVGGPLLILAIPPGSELPCLMADYEQPEVVLDFVGDDEPGTERLIGDLVVPPAGDTVFYTIDIDGSDRHLVRACRLGRPEAKRTLAENAGPALAWDATSKGVLFTVLDDALAPSVVRMVDQDGGPARHVYTVESDSEFADVRMSSDGRRVLVASGTHSTSRMWLLSDSGRLLPLELARPGGRVIADCWADHAAMIWSAAGEPDRLYTTSSLPGAIRLPAAWRCAYEATGGACLEDLVCSDGHVLLIERADGGQRLIRVGLPGLLAAPVEFAVQGARQALGPASIQIVPGLRQRGVTDILRESWQDPASWFRIGPDDQAARPARAGGHPAPGGGIRPSAAMDVLSLKVPSADEAEVPLTLLRPPGRQGPLPTVLYAHGAYGVPLDPVYMPFRLSLLDRGVAFAVAHVRGGGDLGTAWHEGGRGLRKPNAVADYLAAARYLADLGWTPPGMIVARARSAGAVVVGAAVNRAPGLFTAAVLETPFLDCLRILMDPEAALTGPEWDEWGNPHADPAVRAMLADLSPLANVRPAPYPAMLLTVGERDARVQVSESLRFADAVRTATTSARDVLLRIDDTGHLGHSSVTADSHDEADVLAFILDQLGLAVTPAA
ncbi:MAG TPA: prolyl oligopeptidase family serine peptidase [Streptosporangiaceae bacterium]|nr:prolyl oligopeptidase family serine peptidase [Streptosporangiaceae bacterium]